MSAEASWGLLCFLERGLGRDFLEEALRRDTGVLEGLDGGLPRPGGGRSMWMPPKVGESREQSV